MADTDLRAFLKRTLFLGVELRPGEMVGVLAMFASLFLILLVLVQLPKKEAGLGQAFGSGATDALFGSGSV